jgi:thymidylate synthase (FAD)
MEGLRLESKADGKHCGVSANNHAYMAADHCSCGEGLSITGRPISEGAEIYLNYPIKLHNHGFIYLVDYMGDDLAPEEAARVSYGPGTKKSSDSTGLTRYLMRKRHTSPIEMIELKFHLKMPIFVARQWMRHRTASINEMSGRYSILPDEFYIPELDYICEQSEVNNQGRGNQQDTEDALKTKFWLETDAQSAYHHYDKMINEYNTARELARTNLPVSVYTEFYWKVNMHNLLHFLNLRMDDHAQKEIVDYANAIADICSVGWPIVYKAFEDYVLHSVTFSKPELHALKQVLLGRSVAGAAESVEALSSRERKEFVDKLERIAGSEYSRD